MPRSLLLLVIAACHIFLIQAATSIPSTCSQFVVWRELQGNLLNVQATVDSNNNFVVQVQAALVPSVSQYNCGWLFNVSFVNAQNQSQYLQKCTLTPSLKVVPQQQINCSSTIPVCTSTWSYSITSSAVFYCFPWVNISSVPQILPQLQVYFYDPNSATTLGFEIFNLTILLTGNITALNNNSFAGVTLVSVIPVVSTTVNSSSFDLNVTTLQQIYPLAYFNNSNVQFAPSSLQLTEGQSYYASHTFGTAYQNIGVYLAVQSVTLVFSNGSGQALVFQEQARTGNGTLFVVAIPISISVSTINLTLSVLSTVTTSYSPNPSYRRRLLSRTLSSSSGLVSQYYQSSVLIGLLSSSSSSSSSTSNNCSQYYWDGVKYNLCELQNHIALYVCMAIVQFFITGPILIYLTGRSVFFVDSKMVRRIRKSIFLFILFWGLFGIIVVTLTGPYLPAVSLILLFFILLERLLCRRKHKSVHSEVSSPTTVTGSRETRTNGEGLRQDTETFQPMKRASDSHMNSISLPRGDGHSINVQTIVEPHHLISTSPS